MRISALEPTAHLEESVNALRLSVTVRMHATFAEIAAGRMRRRPAGEETLASDDRADGRHATA